MCVALLETMVHMGQSLPVRNAALGEDRKSEDCFRVEGQQGKVGPKEGILHSLQ